MRVESGRVKGQLEASQREVEDVRSELKKMREWEKKASSMSQEVARRTQQVWCIIISLSVCDSMLWQVMEMDQLLKTQQKETTVRRLELERNLARCQSDLRTRTQQLEQLTAELTQSQKVSVWVSAGNYSFLCLIFTSVNRTASTESE